MSKIRTKLDEFIKAHYRQRLIRYAWFAVLCIGFLATFIFLLEYYFWMSTALRQCLFWVLCIGVGFILAFGILKPWLQFKGVGQNLGYAEAAKWIGNYFPDVSDKLLNLLQLEEMSEFQYAASESLLLASIEQKTQTLNQIPFIQALDWQKHKKWVFRAGLLFVLFLGLIAYQRAGIFQGGNRLMHYNRFFVQQAPFVLIVKNSVLVVDEGGDFLLQIESRGKILPDAVDVVMNGETVRARKMGNNRFEFNFVNVKTSIHFGLVSMGYVVGSYNLLVEKRPRWISLKVVADFPDYTGLQDGELPQSEVVQVPEGTKLTFEMRGENVQRWNWKAFGGGWQRLVTDEGGFSKLLHLANKDTRLIFGMTKISNQNPPSQPQPGGNKATSKMFQSKAMDSKIFDTVGSIIQVQPDRFPEIQVDAVEDSLRLGTWYFLGTASDDYALKEMNFYSRIKGGRDSAWKKQNLFHGNAANLPILHAVDLIAVGVAPGQQLEYQFAVRDNDGLRGGKVMKTPVRVLEREEVSKVREQLEKQEISIGKGMQQSTKTLKQLQKESKKLQDAMSSQQMGWDQENKIKDWLNDQQKMVETLKQLEKKQEKLNQQKKEMSPISDDLQKKKDQLNQRMKQLNNPEIQKLIDEINRLLEQKSNKEQLKESMQKLNQMSQETYKELEKLTAQLKQLELEEAIENELNKMAEWNKKEEDLAVKTAQEKGKEASEELKQIQDAQNAKLIEIDQDIQNIKEKGMELENPMKLDAGDEQRKEAGSESQKASKDLQNNKKSAASEKMKKSAQKMKEAMQALQKSFDEEEKKRQAEDYQALRALLENLIDASLRQEDIFSELKKVGPNNPKLTALNRDQMRLKESLLFIEDSLMALAKRQPMIDNFVTKEMGRVNVQMAMALDKLKLRNGRGAAVHEQYLMTGLNNLSEMLMESLQNMQQQMSSDQKKDGDKSCNNPNKSGKGKNGKPKPNGKLSESQKALGEQLQKMQQQKRGKAGEQGKPNESGKPNQPLEQGQAGDQGQRQLNQELAKMALMQEALRRQVEDLRKELGQNGSQGMSNVLKEIEKLMEQQEKDLVNGKVNQQSVERQKQIMTRLLEHENAERQQEQEDRRESNRPIGYRPEIPSDLQESVRKTTSEREQLRKIQPVFRPYYKQSVQKYLQIYTR